MDFHLEQAEVTADSEQMAAELSKSLCGNKRWVVGVAQDLTIAGGCKDIGLALHSLSLELMKPVVNISIFIGNSSRMVIFSY